MTLVPGSRIGGYQVLSSLGAGGMGEVYRARDERLHRDVAVKVLPETLLRDPERRARFEREARLLANVNHPNIAGIYGIEQDGEIPFLVLELVEGDTLAERIASRRLSVPEALPILRQIAEGLEAAHERGIVHRDLKPSNIKVTPDGRVKLLDFGLAKAFATEDNDPVSGSRPDVTVGGTEGGVILGTAPYMSPEQARGKPLDKRTDIWAFGCIVYEVLTGKRAFAGETMSDTIHAVLGREPDWDALPAEARDGIERIAKRCLRKDRSARLRDVGDASIELDEMATGIVPLPRAKGISRAGGPVLWTAVLLALLVGAGAAWLLRGLARETPGATAVGFSRLTDSAGLEEFPAISPDGKSVAFTSDDGGTKHVWVRLRAGGPPLQLTRGQQDSLYPRWSPNSASLLYFSPPEGGEKEGTIWEISALGGSPRRLASALGAADVSHDNTRVAFFRLAGETVELAIADRDGSGVRTVAKLTPAFNYTSPRWSPDDRSLAYQRGVVFEYEIFVTPAAGGEPRSVMRDQSLLNGLTWLADGGGIVYSSSRGSSMLYLPPYNLWTVSLDGSGPKQLTFGETSYLQPDLVQGTLVASRMRMQFDLLKLPLDGTPEENVRRGVPLTQQTGQVQTPSPGPGDRELVYLSDNGGHGNLWIARLDRDEPPRQITYESDSNRMMGLPVWSPDGKTIAFVVRPPGVWNVDLWLVDSNGSNSRKVADRSGWAAWSSDGQWLYFGTSSTEGIWQLKKVRAEGGEPVLIRPENVQAPAISPDGSTLYFVIPQTTVGGGADLEIRAARPETAPSRLLTRISGWRIPAWQLVHPVISPDGSALALPLTDRGVTNIWTISTVDGALHPVTDFGRRRTFIARRVSWSSDGRHLFAAVGEGDSDVVLLEGLIR